MSFKLLWVNINSFLIVCALLLFSGTSSDILAQSFTVEVSSKVVSVGEQFQLSFVLSGSNVGNATGFQPPSFKDFRANGPFQSSSFQVVNGRTSASQSLVYTLAATSKGKFTIGSASINLGSQTFKTAPFTIEVVESSNKGNAGGNAKSSGTTSNQVSTSQLSENCFIIASADKSSALVGEQIIVTYKLFTRMQIAQPQISKLPSYKGFWAEEISTPQVLNLQRENYNGKVFSAVVLKKVALFPSQSGALDVTPFKLKLKVAIEKKRKSQGFFDDFFNDPFFQQQELVEFEAVSNTVKINASALPDDKKPANFTNAVGSYKMDVSIDKQKVKQHDPLTMKITISGSGNIQLVEAPEINLPASVDKFDPKTNMDINRAAGITGKKTFDYLLVPRSEGKVEIPPLKFSYYDTKKKSYETLTSQSFMVEVEKGEGQFANVTANSGKEDVVLLNQDIRYIKTKEPSLQSIGGYSIYKPFTWMLLLAPVFAVAGLLFYKRRETLLLSDLTSLKTRKAEKLAKSKLKAAEKTLKLEQVDQFYTVISSSLFGYLEDKFSIPKAELSRDRIFDTVEIKTMKSETILSLRSALDECEFARFAPVEDKRQGMQGLYSKSIKLIIDIEAELLEKKRGMK